MPAIKSHGDAEIYYETYGTGPTPLLFIHGWGGDGQLWSDVLPHLDKARFRCVCVDLRGHGRSNRPGDGYNWESFSQDVLAVADEEQATRFVPVGFSMGGKLACYMAARNPGRIPAQVLLAPAPPGVVPIEREGGLQICREASDKQKVKSVFGAWFGPTARYEVVDACCGTIAKTPRSVLEATAEMTLWTSIEPEVVRLKLPTLLVHGSHDPVYGEAFQRMKMLPFLTNPRIAPVSSGHFIPLECPADLEPLISGFIGELGLHLQET
jgi:pimeloyl-ACP methyl ester carboxylesterase